MSARLGTLLLCVGLCACDGDERPKFAVAPPTPLPECPDENYASCDIRSADCQRQLSSLAACMRGSELLGSLKIEVMSPEQYLDVALADFGDTPEPVVKHADRALALLGFQIGKDVGRTQRQVDSIADLGGVYRVAEKRIVIIDHGKPADTPYIDAILLHEFVHAYQDVDYDLLAWPDGPDAPTNFDEQLALSTLIEGEASFYQYRAASALLGIDPSQVDFNQTFQSHFDYVMGHVYESDAPFGETRSTVPYAYGATLAHEAWKQGGQRGIDALWASPPRTTQQVMAQFRKRNVPQARGADFTTSELADATLEPYTDGPLGAWGLNVFLFDNLGSTGFKQDQPLSWRGDHLWVYRNASETTYALWQLVLEDEPTARFVDQVFQSLPNVQHRYLGNKAYVAVSSGIVSPELASWAEAWLKQQP